MEASMTMNAEKLVEAVARAIFQERQSNFYAETYPDDWKLWVDEAEAAIGVVVKECAAKAAIASLGTAKETAASIQRAILSLSPDAKEAA
jgi:hypothetical protein